MPRALARHVRGTTAKTVPGDQPGRTQDTGDRADRTAVRGRAKAQGIEVKHRRRVPAEPLVEFKAATGQQNPGHPSLPGYAVSRSCRDEYVELSRSEDPGIWPPTLPMVRFQVKFWLSLCQARSWGRPPGMLSLMRENVL